MTSPQSNRAFWADLSAAVFTLLLFWAAMLWVARSMSEDPPARVVEAMEKLPEGGR